MVKINKNFINEAISIRKEYLDEIKILTEKENKIIDYQNRLKSFLNDIEKYVKINKDSDVSEEQISIDLNSELAEIEITMNKIKNDVGLLDNKIKFLQEKSRSLYQKIINKYPELTQEEIQKEIFYSLKE